MEYRASGLTEGRASMPGELHLSHGIFQQKPPKKQKNCDYNSNLGETAQSFMSRCVKGSAKAEFPSQYLNSTLAEIKSKASSDDDAKKAKKLLTDGRFRK